MVFIWFMILLRLDVNWMGVCVGIGTLLVCFVRLIGVDGFTYTNGFAVTLFDWIVFYRRVGCELAWLVDFCGRII